MIFGVLNLEKIWHNSSYICPPHLYTVATLPWEIKTVIFQQYYSYRPTSDYLRYLRRKQTVTSLPTTHEKMSPHYLVKIAQFLKFFSFFTRIDYRVPFAMKRYGSVLLRHGLNFSRVWSTMQLISGEKDWKHVFVQKVVILNICCNVACLSFHLPHFSTVFSQPPMSTHNRLLSEPPTFGGMHIPSVRWKTEFYKAVLFQL